MFVDSETVPFNKVVNVMFISEADPDTLMSWTQKHPEHWTQSEILDWIYFVAGTIDVDPTTIRGEGFQNISGPELCRMAEEDFSRRDPVNGKLFYDMFRMLFKDGMSLFDIHLLLALKNKSLILLFFLKCFST